MKTWILAALLAGVVPVRADSPTKDAAPANTAAAAKRELWLGTEGRYVRQWRVLGPMTPEDADALAAAGQPTKLADSSAQPWRFAGSYGDVLDAFSASNMRDGETAFAMATVERAADGDASIWLGGNVRGVWVNGEWRGGGADSPAFVMDGTEVRARLQRGPNRILLRVSRLDRPVLLSLRVTDPGFVGRLPMLSPYLVRTADDALLVMPGARGTEGAQVVYDVLAPGGEARATIQLTRAQEARFVTRGWPDGPYEVRVRTRDALGEESVVYLPWIKGDAHALAQRVLDAAAAAGASDPVKMLADMIRDRESGDAAALHSPLMEFAELERERAGLTGGARGGGFVRLAWTDDIDGSTQYCRAYLPSVYPTVKPKPALLFLHGYNPFNPPYVRWWSIAERHNGVAERHDLIVLEPMGRGNTDYRGFGELDVLRCLAEAKRRFLIDADRVYVSGESMGGNGAWLLATRNPHLFAAAAPVFGGWDYRVTTNGYNYTNPLAKRPMERFLQEAHASFAGAEGLRNVPLYVVHGDADNAVSTDFSRHAVGMLQRWGYDVRYREVPGRGHEDVQARDEIADWLLLHTRVTNPREVRLRSFDLAGAGAYWLAVDGWIDPFEMMEARGQVIDGSTLRVDTKNVAELTLTPPDPLRRNWAVLWNDRSLLAQVGDDRKLHLLAPGVAAKRDDKSRLREGRLYNFFDTPFALVVGTSAKDPALRAALEAKAQAFVTLWRRWQHAAPRVFDDVELTPELESKYSLLLLGGPDANRISARLAAKLPARVTRDAIEIDGRRFAARDAVAQVLYPHPGNDARYVLQVSPQSAAALRFWNPGAYWHALNGFPLLHWDWTIADGRHVPIGPGLSPDRGWIAAGIFDRHWRRDDRFTVTGDADARSRAPLRAVPAAPPVLAAETLAVLTGRYVINPGQIGSGGTITVTVEDGTLFATQPEGGLKLALEPETATAFAVVGTGAPVRFATDGGRPSGLTFNHNGLDLVATRVQ
ncbi:MAG TPA: prolyl oligopeptidase family serine peptidase [Steroidobacteraceae bacterium]|nr:prolyl oligopeptidase family serine peptidase [Steroidobacteraceae bacterium]